MPLSEIIKIENGFEECKGASEQSDFFANMVVEQELFNRKRKNYHRQYLIAKVHVCRSFLLNVLEITMFKLESAQLV